MPFSSRFFTIVLFSSQSAGIGLGIDASLPDVDLRNRPRFDPGHAVVGDHRRERGRDRLTLADVQVRPQAGRPGDEPEVPDVTREHGIVLVSQATLEGRIEELLPLEREPLRAPRDLGDGQAFVGELQQLSSSPHPRELHYGTARSDSAPGFLRSDAPASRQ